MSRVVDTSAYTTNSKPVRPPQKGQNCLLGNSGLNSRVGSVTGGAPKLNSQSSQQYQRPDRRSGQENDDFFNPRGNSRFE